MNFSEVLGRAFQITWRTRYLWLLAILAGECGASPSFSGQGFTPSTRSSTTVGGTTYSGPSNLPFDPQQAQDWITSHQAEIVRDIFVSLALLGVLSLIWFVISLPASAALIRAAAQSDGERPFSLGQAWRAGMRRAWAMLGLRLIELGFVLVIGVIIAVPVGLVLSSVRDQSAGLVVGILGLLVLIPVLIVAAVLVGILFQLAARSTVLDPASPVSAVGNALRLMRRRLGRVLLAFLVSIGVGIGVGIVVGIADLVVGLPLAGLVFAGWSAGGLRGLLGALVIAGPVVLIVFAIIGGAVGAFNSVYWTLVYRRLDLEPLPPPAPTYVAPPPSMPAPPYSTPPAG